MRKTLYYNYREKTKAVAPITRCNRLKTKKPREGAKKPKKILP